jgi:hypothetical protein
MRKFQISMSVFFAYNKGLSALLFCSVIFNLNILQARSGQDSCVDCINYDCIAQLHEQVYLHLSRWSVVAGERLNFKAYVIKNKSIESKILYIEIFDSKNNLKVFGKANLDSGICMSSIPIPDSLSTGLYQVLAYTNLMRNYPASSFLHSSLLIIGMNNKTQNVTNSGSEAHDKNANSIELPNQNLISTDAQFTTTLDKTVYGLNEKVSLNIDINKIIQSPAYGSFSIAVYEKLPDIYSNLNSSINIVNNLGSSNTYNSGYSKWLEINKGKSLSFPYKTENKTFLLNGVLIDKTSGKPEKEKIVYLSTPDSIANLKYSITDTFGRFMFALDKRYDNRLVLLNTSDDNELKESKEYTYQIDNKQFYDSLAAYETLVLDSQMNDFILRSKKIASINKVYFKTEESKANIEKINSKIHFYSKPDYSIKLADYTELDNLSEITENLLPSIVFKKRKDKYLFCVGSLVFQEFPNRKCFVLLNNIPFNNYEYLSTLGSHQIESIEIIHRNLFYGDIDFAGIVSIYTKDKTIIPDKQTFIFENKVEKIVNQEKKKKDQTTSSKLPDFQQVLLWNPDLKLDKNGHASVEFNTSSLPGEYFIDIEGLTQNGIPVSKRLIFKVQ